MRKKLLALLPLLIMVFFYSRLPDIIQMIELDIMRFQASENKTSSFDNTKATYAQVEETEISIDTFPKLETDRDDTERIQRAVDYCMENDKDLFFPSGGSYVLRSVNVEAGLRIVGYGATFTLADAQPKFTRMFTTTSSQWESAEDSDYLIFEGMTFDGNVWNQGAFLNYELEQQFAIMYMGSIANTGMLRGKVINCRFQNWAADGVHIYTNADVEVVGCSSINCFRGGVVATGGPANVKISDYVGEKGQFGKVLDVEVETSPAAPINVTIDSMIAYGGVDLATQPGSVVTVDGLTVIGGETYIYGFGSEVTINNSVLGNVEMRNATNCVFNDTTFVITPDTTDDSSGVLAAVGDDFDLIPKQDYYAEFNRCTFERVDKDKLVEMNYELNALKGYFGKIALNDCVIGKGFTTGYYNLGVAYSDLINVTFESDIAIAMQPLEWARIFKMVLDNVQYVGTNASPYHFLGYTNTKPYIIVEFKNIILDSSTAGYAVDKRLGTTQIVSSRIIYVDADPTTTSVPGFAGDIAKLYTPVDGEPAEWVATSNDPVAATWKIVE